LKVIVGTYRKRDYIEACLRSLEAHVSGVTEIEFVDDSGDAEQVAWLSQYGKVYDLPQAGFTAAMKVACVAAAGQHAMWLEEDFEFLVPVDLDEMAEMLVARPHLAQLALLRGPHFPDEHMHGGVIECLKQRGHKFTKVDGVIEHNATFTCNPAVWQPEVFSWGWPDEPWSEDKKRNELVGYGYRFAYLPGVRVRHSGVRSGKGY
jgi:glycosyltransferase involved in cell wall biosynthesis